MKRNIILKVALLFLAIAIKFSASAQQDPMYTQYMFNTLAVNPAYAGSADMMTVNALYRHQWTDFQGAPQTSTLTFHSPLRRESIGVGFSGIWDKHGPVQQTGVYADVSYRIFFDESRLSFGLKGGVNFYAANLLDLSPLEENDPTFAANISSRSLPNFGFGVYWNSKRSYVGLSVPKILSNELLDGDLPSFTNNKERQHYFLIAGTVLELNNYTYFKPSILIKAVDGAPLSFDITANFLFYEKLWLGAMYRFEESVGILLQYEVNNKFKLGYSYDYSLSALGNYSSGSHEVMLGFDFGKKFGGDKSPRFF